MGGITLGDFWFVIAAIFWTGFFVLEGFDFGVGMLHSFIGRNDLERRVVVNTIGPVWDGNEVWLIVAGAILFSAFPGWYATMFSSLYLAMVILLAALMALPSGAAARDSTKQASRLTAFGATRQAWAAQDVADPNPKLFRGCCFLPKQNDSKIGVRASRFRIPSFLLAVDGPAKEESGEVYGGSLEWRFGR